MITINLDVISITGRIKISAKHKLIYWLRKQLRKDSMLLVGALVGRMIDLLNN